MTSKSTAPAAGESAASEKAANTVEVELSAPHTHAGKRCKAGDKIKVTQRQKAFLQDSKKIGVVVGTAERVKES